MKKVYYIKIDDRFSIKYVTGDDWGSLIGPHGVYDKINDILITMNDLGYEDDFINTKDDPHWDKDVIESFNYDKDKWIKNIDQSLNDIIKAIEEYIIPDSGINLLEWLINDKEFDAHLCYNIVDKYDSEEQAIKVIQRKNKIDKLINPLL